MADVKLPDLKNVLLTQGARDLITNLQLPEAVQMHLTSVGEKRPISETELAILMLHHTPADQHAHIQNRVAALYDGKGPHTDGKNPAFVGQIAHILSAQVKKELAVPVLIRRNLPQPPPPPPIIAVPRRDPLFGKVFFPDAADFVVIANNSSTDKRRVMDVVHILVREGLEDRIGDIDFKGARLRYTPRANHSDITVVKTEDIAEAKSEQGATQQGKPEQGPVQGGRAAIVDFVDTDEHQFRSRDTMISIPFDKSGAEIKAGRDGRKTEATIEIYEYAPLRPSDPNEPLRPALDTIPFNDGRPYVVSGDQADQPGYAHEGVRIGDQMGRLAEAHAELVRLQLIETAGVDPRVRWTNTPVSGFLMGLVVGEATVGEAGEALRVQVLGTNVETSAPAGDWNVPGNPQEIRALNLAQFGGQTYAQLMNGQRVTLTSSNHQFDQVQRTPLLGEQAFMGAEQVTVGGEALKRLGDEPLSVEAAKARGITVAWSTGKDGALMPVVSLKDGFLGATGESSVNGWRIDVGYVSNNQWSGAPTLTVGSADRSPSKTMMLPGIPAEAVDPLLNNGFIEVQVRTHESHMAQRIRIPMKEIQHATKKPAAA